MSDTTNDALGIQSATLFVSLITMLCSMFTLLRMHLKSTCCGKPVDINLGKSKSDSSSSSSSEASNSSEEDKKQVLAKVVTKLEDIKLNQ
jgi:hypothetical protein